MQLWSTYCLRKESRDGSFICCIVRQGDELIFINLNFLGFLCDDSVLALLEFGSNVEPYLISHFQMNPLFMYKKFEVP